MGLESTKYWGQYYIYQKFVDSVISANNPSKTDDPLLPELVQTYQIHSHSNSCKKNKKTEVVISTLVSFSSVKL